MIDTFLTICLFIKFYLDIIKLVSDIGRAFKGPIKGMIDTFLTICLFIKFYLDIISFKMSHHLSLYNKVVVCMYDTSAAPPRSVKEPLRAR